MTEVFKLEHRFAWLPVYIRNRRTYVLGVFTQGHWTWFRKYTRIYRNGRTYDTVLGHRGPDEPYSAAH